MVTICFVTGWVNPDKTLPLIFASNRDEFYERGGEPPALREGEKYQYFSPLDPKCGGSWLGVNSEGLFVALTNGVSQAGDKESPSRGLLVTDILGTADGLETAVEMVRDIELDPYPAFSLLFLAPEGIFCLEYEGPGKTEKHQEDKGSFFVSDNSDMELYSFDRWSRFPWGGNGLEARPERLRGRLQNFCRQHRGFGGHGAMRKHGEEAGTVSSSIIIIDIEKGRLLNDYAPGAPCETTYSAVKVNRNFEKKVIESWKNGG